MMKNTSWTRLVIFYGMAVVLSNFFRFDFLNLKELTEAWPPWIKLSFYTLSEGSGIWAGAFLAFTLLKRKRASTISLWGTDKTKSLLMAAVPVFLLAGNGVNNPYGMEIHIYGLLAGLCSLLYCLAEEYGWRAYLHEEFSVLAEWKKYIMTGVLWYVWHLSFLQNASVTQNLFFLVMLIAASWGLGQVVKATRSVMASAGFHMAINIMAYNQLIKNGLASSSKFIILAVCLLLFILLIKNWNRPVRQASNL